MLRLDDKEIKKLLSKLLVEKISDKKSCLAKGVTLDVGNHAKKIDFLQFTPAEESSVSGIEKGIFTFYEIKTNIEEIYSDKSLYFFGEKNYIVTTMECYQKLNEDMRNGKFMRYLKNEHPDASTHFGIIVALPVGKMIQDEFFHPTPLDKEKRWELKIAFRCSSGFRKRSMTELLYRMIQAESK